MKKKASKTPSRPPIPPKALREIWDMVPDIQCKGLCSNSCGPIDLTAVERRLIEKRTGKKLAARGSQLTCSMLKNGRCSVYSIRPVICRLWGVVESMPCPHGCKPERVLTDREGFEISGKALELSGESGENFFYRVLEEFNEEELAAFKKFVSNSGDLGNNETLMREGAQELEAALNRRLDARR